VLILPVTIFVVGRLTLPNALPFLLCIRILIGKTRCSTFFADRIRATSILGTSHNAFTYPISQRLQWISAIAIPTNLTTPQYIFNAENSVECSIAVNARTIRSNNDRRDGLEKRVD
jgi:hypothetical protein